MGRNLKAEGYRLRAVEIRAIADIIRNPENKAKMLAIAADYDRMADQVERGNPFSGAPAPG